MKRHNLFQLLLGVLILVIGTLFVPSLLHQYHGISEVTPEEGAKRMVRVKNSWWYHPRKN